MSRKHRKKKNRYSYFSPQIEFKNSAKSDQINKLANEVFGSLYYSPSRD